MKLFNRIACLTVFLTFYFQSSFAQWQALSGPFGVETSSAVFFDSVYFAATAVGLTNSTDSAQNWQLDTINYVNGTSSKIIFKEGKLILDRLYNTNGGIISSDSGKTWNLMTSAGSFPPIKYDITSDTIYTWCEYSSLFYSANNGLTWNAMSAPPTSNNINDFVTDNGRIYVLRSVFGTGQGNIYYSDNAGTNWQALPTTGITGTTINPYQLIPNGNQLFLVCSSGLYKSTDGGNTWTLFNSGLPSGYCCYAHFTHISISKNKIYASVSNNGGLFQSDTAMASFNDITTGLPLEVYVNSVTEHHNFLYASTLSGLFRTDKNSIDWNLIQNGIHALSCYSLEANDSNLFAGTRSAFHVSHNNGDSFTSMPGGVNAYNFYKDGNEVFAAGARGYKTSDGGYTWSDINYPYGFYGQNLTDFCIVNGNYWGLNVDQTIRYSASNGSAWNVVSGVPASTANCIAGNNGALFAGTSNGIYKTSTTGASWSIYLTGYSFWELKTDNGNIYALSDNDLWVSYNNGSTWNNMNYPGVNPISFTVRNSMVIVTPGLYYTNNFGVNWDSLSAPSITAQSSPSVLAMNDDFLFAGYYNTIFRLPLSVVTKVNETAIGKIDVQVNPNPVSDFLHIRFMDGSNKEEKTTVKIFDVAGRILFNEIILTDKNKELNLNFNRFYSGIYFLQLNNVKGRIVRKIVKE